MVCLCSKCHLYIHSSLLSILVQKGEYTKEYKDEVLAKGDAILAKHNLKKQESLDSLEKIWMEKCWKLIYEGQDIYPLLAEMYETEQRVIKY